MSAPGELSFYALAKALGLDPRGVARDVKRGMPRDVEGALAWRMAYVRPQKGTKRPTLAEALGRGEKPEPKVVAFEYANPPAEDEKEDLEACLSRLRRLERTCAATLERLLREGRVAESQALRREHSSMIKSLFDASSKLLKLEETRGKLVRLDIALSMISEALAPSIIMLRQLPALGRDAEERNRLEVFLNAVLNEMQSGAETGLKRSSAGVR